MKELQKEYKDHKWLPVVEGWEMEGLGRRREPIYIDVSIVLFFNHVIELPIQKLQDVKTQPLSLSYWKGKQSCKNVLSFVSAFPQCQGSPGPSKKIQFPFKASSSMA